MDRNQQRKAAKAYNLGLSLYGLIFSVVWCVIAASMGAGIMLIFGIPFVGITAFRLVMCIKMAKKKPQEPWDKGNGNAPYTGAIKGEGCPYCGSEIQESYVFCPKCGRRM